MKLIMENWKRFLQEQTAMGFFARPMTERETNILIKLWKDQYLKGKKWNPSVVKLYSQQETATSGKVSSKEKLDDSELYKGDNAYYTILSELTDIRDIPAVQKFSKELLKSRMDKLELHNKKAYLEFRQAIIAATKYADQPGKFDKMEQAGANVKLAWNAKVKEIVDDIQKSTGYEKTTVNTKTTLSPSVDQ